MALLEAQGLEKWYGKRKVVDGVSYEVNPGEIVGLLGPNGAGKTTSFRMTTGQITPNGGRVLFDSQEVTTLPMFRRARLGMGYLSQEQSIFRKLTVEQNLIAILEALPTSRTLGRKLTRSERWDRAEEALARFKLTHVRKNVAGRCSGGEKRRLEIARCLVCEPLLILLDEPFAAVDPKTTEDIRANIRELAETGIGILLTDHNVREVVKTADRIYLIVNGKVVCHGTPDKIIRDKVAIDAYLGTTFEDDVLMARLAGFAGGTPAVPPQPVVVPTPKQEQIESPKPVPVPVPAPRPAPPVVPPAPSRPAPLAPAVPTPSAPVAAVPPVPRPAATIPPSPSAPAKPAPTLPPPIAFPGSPVFEPRPGGFSGSTHLLLEQEKTRRLVERLRDEQAAASAGQELLARGPQAVPALLEALEWRDLRVRYLAFNLLKQIVGEPLTFEFDAPDDVRLRQVAYLRAKLERRAG